MDAERYQQVKRLYMAAVELDEEGAAAFLDVACADDHELRGEVESLLAHHRLTTLLADDVQKAGKGQLVRPLLDDAPMQTPAGTTQTDPPQQPSRQSDTEPDSERFPPGTTVAGRYRILGLLGRGGMGEVYRADDLRLEQTVALKFLASSRSADEAWLARFHDEVRLARRVTHPNVNRVYDIGEADGEVFLSMEYVDGEDLGSLLRRVGRLPGERALRMARELCAGLGAAHDRGVLHRDLKPANVMIDGLGHVRITDFGIAVAKSDAETTAMAGTPAYMAPELFKGAEASVASDLYALGIVLHELVTGESPFQAAGAPGSPKSPALPALSGKVDLKMERVIRRCLTPDPHDRPESAYSVLAALPGGDALAAALAAGQMPSPEMVAAAAEQPAERPLIVALLAIAMVGLAAVFLLADRTMFLPQAGLEKPPAVLADRAEELLRQLGQTSPIPGRVSGFAVDQRYLDYVANNPQAAEEELPSVYFWYRQGDRRLPPPPPLGATVSSRRLPPVEGMNVVHLDGRGRLLQLAVYQHDMNRLPPGETVEQADWSILFTAAGLDRADYEPVTPDSPPPMYADEVVAWQCLDGASRLLPRRVHAASVAGRVVFFDVILPWEKTDDNATSQLLSGTTSPAFAALFWLRIITLIAALVMARHNLRLGRGDVRAARRFAVFVFALAMLDWIVGERHVLVFREEAAASLLWTSRATFAAAVAWFTYVAVEPYVRRLWPRTIVTWTRLIAGRFRDPLVGRDVLVGTVFGIALTWIDQIDFLLGRMLTRGSVIAKLPSGGYELGDLLGLRYKLGTAVSQTLGAITFGMLLLLLLLVLRILFRDGRRGAVAFCVVATLVYGFWATLDISMPWLLGLATGLAVVFVLTRVGFVALAVGLFVQAMLTANPLTMNWAAWYAPAAIFAGVVTLGFAGYGFHTALTGRRAL